MIAHLPLSEMSMEEKLQAMEMIWDDLCSRAEDLPSPAWHGEALAEIEASVERGETTFEDWETAKKKIRDKIS